VLNVITGDRKLKRNSKLPHWHDNPQPELDILRLGGIGG